MKKFFALLLISSLLVSGCVQQQAYKQGTGKEIPSDSGGVTLQNDSAGISGATPNDADSGAAQKEPSFYRPFSKQEYEKAKAAGKIIYLEFYADWCPICARQKPVIESAFSDALLPKGIAGFQVNYKDSETDSDEEALAREFGITYQHQRVILKSGSVIERSSGNIGKEELLGLLKEASQEK